MNLVQTNLKLESKAKFESLEVLYEKVGVCTACQLCQTRKNVVLFRGNPEAKLMVIGEGPGQREDETGLPFVGKAGQLLDKILASVNIDREKDVYICNVVKCRPPGNRPPLPVEMEACFDYLSEQVRMINPKIILLAGATAVNAVMKVKEPISKIRGKWFQWENGSSLTIDTKVMPIFHPSYLLRNDTRRAGSPKWLMWQDIQEVRKQLDLL